MDCVQHSGVAATAYCQNCGKPLCAECVRTGAGGQVFCAPCYASWQGFQQPFVTSTSAPHPSAAAVLGLIPGVGAMYNGQFFKGLIHVVIFAVLVSIAGHHSIFGIFVAAWILYQSFEAFHTAKALRDGLPPPDPLGLNEVGNWLNLGARPRYPGQPGFGASQTSPGAHAPGSYPPSPAAAPGSYGSTPAGNAPSSPAPYEQQPYQQQQSAWQTPAQGTAQSGFTPDPSEYWRPMWRRREPIGAVVLIALGLLFLLAQLDIFAGRLLGFTWPLLLIALGVWLIVHRLKDSQGASK